MKNTVIQDRDQVFAIFGMRVEEASTQYARVTMPIGSEYHNLNGMGVAQGGATYSLADITFGVASNCEEETNTVTLSSSFHFLAPGKASPLTCEAKLVRGGRHIVTYDLVVRDAAGRLVATGTFQGFRTQNLLPK